MSKKRLIKHAITMPHMARLCGKPVNERLKEQGVSFLNRHTVNFSVADDNDDGRAEYSDIIVENVIGLESSGRHQWFSERAVNQAGATVVTDQYSEREFKILLRLQAGDSVGLDKVKDLVDTIFSPENASVAFPPAWGSVGALVDIFGSVPPCVEKNHWTYTKVRSDGQSRHVDFFPLSVSLVGSAQATNTYSLSVEIVCVMFDPFVYGTEETLYFNGNSIARGDWNGSEPPSSVALQMPCYAGTRPAPYVINITTISPPSPNELCGMGFSLEETGVNRLLAHSNLNGGGTCWPIFQVVEGTDTIRLDTNTFTQNFSITSSDGSSFRQLDGNLDPNASTVAEMLLVPQHTHQWFLITDQAVAVGGEGKPLASLTYSPRYGTL